MGAAVLALTLIPATFVPAAAMAGVTHRETSKPAAHHPVARHVAARHVVEHKTVEHHGPVHHVVAHHVAERHETVRHTTEHNELMRRVAYHVPVRHAATRHETVRRAVVYHPKYDGKLLKSSKAVYFPRWVSCVPYARAVSGIRVGGNAKDWWYTAAGRYARGQRPEPGSVLDFRGIGRMPLGHVSVVTRVVNSREIQVEHANWWGPGSNNRGISHNVAVVDVSPDNSWTEVRVSLGRPGEFGSPYPTYGFIYDRPDNGVILANTHTRATTAQHAVEVAEAPPVAKIATQPLHHSVLDLGGAN